MFGLKVSKSQKQFFLKLHCPKNERNQNFVKYFVRFLVNGVSRKDAFQIYWPLAWDFCLCLKLKGQANPSMFGFVILYLSKTKGPKLTRQCLADQ